MDIPWVRIISQSGVYLTFALYLYWAAKRGPRLWAPLVSAIGYAILFEHWNMLRYSQVQGGYHYHVGSWLWLWGDVPLYIPLAWAFILSTSASITDQLRLRAWARPFSDALLALLIDISMDAVAIRLKFWYWHGVGLNDAFFGVPADNFVGWLLVSFTFAMLTRLLWHRVEPKSAEEGATRGRELGPVFKVSAQIAVIPPIAYLLYLGFEAVVHMQYRAFHAESLRGQLFVLLGTVILFAGVAVAGRTRFTEARGNDHDGAEARRAAHGIVVHGPRHTFHLFGLIGLLLIPPATRSPALCVLALVVWSIEWIISLLASSRAGVRLERNELVHQLSEP